MRVNKTLFSNNCNPIFVILLAKYIWLDYSFVAMEPSYSFSRGCVSAIVGMRPHRVENFVPTLCYIVWHGSRAFQNWLPRCMRVQGITLIVIVMVKKIGRSRGLPNFLWLFLFNECTLSQRSTAHSEWCIDYARGTVLRTGIWSRSIMTWTISYFHERRFPRWPWLLKCFPSNIKVMWRCLSCDLSNGDVIYVRLYSLIM